MKLIKHTAELMEHNIEEARHHIENAYRHLDSDKALTTWERDMALAHLKFNDAGHALANKLIDAEKQIHADDERIAGMMSVWNDKHGDMMKDASEVKYLIDNLKV